MNPASEAWVDLRRAGKGDGKLEIPSLPSRIETGYGPIRFGLGSAGEARLLVPCATTRVRVSAEPTEKLGLRVLEYHGPEGRQAYIDLLCRDAVLETVFSELASEVLRRVEEGASPESAVSGAIEDFRALLSRAPSGAPSRAEILGLVGELYMLAQLVELDPSRGLSTWLGPWEQRHDFRAGNAAMEIKTSGRSDTSRVSIHGADQLLPPRGGSLVLVQLRLEEAPGANLSVSRLFDAIQSKTSPSARLEEGLSLIGCADPHCPLWNGHSFALEAMYAWDVREGFPRITPAELRSGALPRGTGNLEYTLDLSAADDFRMPSADLQDYMEKMAHGQTQPVQ